MIEVILPMYLVGYVEFLCCHLLIIAYDYISNPFPKSSGFWYKTRIILGDILLAALMCIFWPILIIVQIICL